METAAAKANRERHRQQRRSLAIVRLSKVCRAASVVVAGAQSVDKGLYWIRPGDVMHLRRCIEEAKEVLNEEGVIG